MGVSIKTRRTETTAPLTLSITRNGPVVGATAVVAVRDGDTPDSYLDFADDTFKVAGHTTRQAALADIGGGFYHRALDVNAITNLPAPTDVLVVEYEVTAPANALGVAGPDILLLEEFVDDVPAAVDTTLSASHGATSWLSAVGFSTHSAADVDTVLVAAHGAGAWITATGFATTADVVTLVAEHDATQVILAALPAAIDVVLSAAHGSGLWDGTLSGAQAIQLQETWTSLGNNIAAPASFDFPGLFIRALANVTPIDIVISVVGTTVTLTRQP